MPSSFQILVYPDPPFGGRISPVPGVRLEAATSSLSEEERRYIDTKLWSACRKLALAWYGGDQALRAEQEFYSQTYHDNPGFFGEHAVYVHYHLESFVLLARAAMDISSSAFSRLLPPPFQRKRCDSLNDLVKRIHKDLPNSELDEYFVELGADPASWFGLLTSVGERRGLRDKLAHQMEFPIIYDELNEGSEMERPVVLVTNDIAVSLEKFVDGLRTGVVEGFLRLEDACLNAMPSAP